MNGEQVSFDLEPEHIPITEEEKVVACFWKLHLQDCTCEVNWWKWEKDHNGNIWTII